MNLNLRSKIFKTTKKTIKKKINNKTFETNKKNKIMPWYILRATKYTKCNYHCFYAFHRDVIICIWLSYLYLTNKSCKCFNYFKKYSVSGHSVGIGEWKHMEYGETYHFKNIMAGLRQLSSRGKVWCVVLLYTRPTHANIVLQVDSHTPRLG